MKKSFQQAGLAAAFLPAGQSPGIFAFLEHLFDRVIEIFREHNRRLSLARHFRRGFCRSNCACTQKSEDRDSSSSLREHIRLPQLSSQVFTSANGAAVETA